MAGQREASPAQLANLRPFGTLSEEEQKELSRKGAIAANTDKPKRKEFKDALEWLLEQPAMYVNNRYIIAMQSKFPNLTNREAMTIAVVGKVLQTGDAKCFAIVRDTMGEVPTSKLSVSSGDSMVINIRTVDSVVDTMGRVLAEERGVATGKTESKTEEE